MDLQPLYVSEMKKSVGLYDEAGNMVVHITAHAPGDPMDFAKRLAACWRVCASVSTADLHSGQVHMSGVVTIVT